MMDDSSLKDGHGVPIVATQEQMFSSQAFICFEQQLDRDLQRLVARWAHMAAPAATRRTRRTIRTRKQKPKKPR